MTRITILLLCALTFSAAFGLADDDLEVLWEYPYDPVLMNSAFSSWGRYYTQDEFILETDSKVMFIEFWGIYSPDDDYHPQPFWIIFLYDHYGMPGGYFDGGCLPLGAITETDTGEDYHGNPVYHYSIDISGEPMSIDAGQWWLDISAETENFKWGGRGQTGGILYHNYLQYNASVYFRLLGTPSGAGVEETSWGEIKAQEW